jgi:DNA-directed RNA polymerase subunit beta'
LVLSKNGQVVIADETERELERYTIPSGAIISVPEGKVVDKEKIFVKWNPYISPIISELSGRIKFEDIIEDKTVKKELDVTTGLYDRVIIDQKGEYHPQIVILNDKKEILAIYTIPVGAHIVIKDGQQIKAGTLLAKTPRKISKTTDITGGLPRVAELFEARKPKDPAIISEIDGIVEFGTTKKGQRRIIITSSTGMKKEYIIPHGKHLNVYKGDKVKSGQKLVDGPIAPQDILQVLGDKKLQEFLVNEIQEVYRLQGVEINDKHIEVIVRQMLKKMSIESPGDTDFLVGTQVDKIKFQEENERVIKKGKKPAQAKPILLGITKASLSVESFIAAASFQETTRVLTDAAASGRTDKLLGLKENVIMGHLIPAGTGFAAHRDIKVVKEGKPVEETQPEQEGKGER